MKIIAESLQQFRIEEGVADKYAEKRFGIPDEESEFEKEYQQSISGKSSSKIGEVKGRPLVKNPKNLSSFPPGSRGVITKDGNLYLVADVENVIHVDILNTLKKLGIINTKTRGWENPEDLDKFEYVTVQRVFNKPAFAIGESYALPKPKREEERKKALLFFKPYFEAAKKKNPKFEFIYNQPRSAARQLLSSSEYEKYRTSGS